MQWLHYRLDNTLSEPDLSDVDYDILKEFEMIETNMERIWAKAVADGVLIGEQRGLQLGRLEGQSMLLERQLAKRFGPVTDETRTRLKTATADQLETWAERILDAKTLAEVFNEH